MKVSKGQLNGFRGKWDPMWSVHPPGRSACPEPGSLSQCFQRLSYLAWTKKTLFLEFGPGWTRGNRDTSLQTSAPGEVWIPHCAPHTGSSLYIKMGKDTLQVFYLCSLAQGDSWKNKCFKLDSVTGSRILLRLTWQNLLHIHIQEKLLRILTISYLLQCVLPSLW